MAKVVLYESLPHSTGQLQRGWSWSNNNSVLIMINLVGEIEPCRNPLWKARIWPPFSWAQSSYHRSTISKKQSKVRVTKPENKVFSSGKQPLPFANALYLSWLRAMCNTAGCLRWRRHFAYSFWLGRIIYASRRATRWVKEQRGEHRGNCTHV